MQSVELSQKLKFLNLEDSKSQENSFSIMNWNILADCFVSHQYFPYVKSTDYLSYQYRIEKIKNIIKQRNSSIVNLQQVDQNQNFFQFLKEQGYEYHYRPKGSQGLVIAYKTQLFTLKTVKFIDFDSTISEKVDKVLYAKGHGAIVLKLETKSKRSLIVANTHLFWDPKLQKIKYHQTCSAVTAIYDLYNPGDAIVFTGDFNSLPYSNVVRVVQTNQKPDITRCIEGNQNYPQMNEKFNYVKAKLLKLNSVYSDSEGKYTNYTKDFKGRIDYIFYNQLGLKVVKTGELFSEQQMSREVGLPNSTFPSDHIPLWCKFQFEG